MPHKRILVIADGFLWTRPMLHEPGDPIHENIEACKGLCVTVMTPATRSRTGNRAVRIFLNEFLLDAEVSQDYQMPEYDELWAAPERVGAAAPEATTVKCGDCGRYKPVAGDCETCEAATAFKPPETLIEAPAPPTPEESAAAAGTDRPDYSSVYPSKIPLTPTAEQLARYIDSMVGPSSHLQSR